MSSIVHEMKIKAFAPWFGGKRTMAEDIIAEAGPHTQWFNPCCGALSIELTKAPSQKETVNDLHGDITNLARVLQDIDAAEKMYGRLQRVVMCDGLLDDAGKYLASGAVGDEPDPERAYWYFLASWMGRNGTAGTSRPDYQLAVRWTKNGGSPSVRFQNAVGSIPAWHQRLRNIVVTRRDMYPILSRFEDCKGTAIVFDPPYPPETRSNLDVDGEPKRGGGGGTYLHEIDHSNSLEQDGSALFAAKESTWFGTVSATMKARDAGKRVDEHRLAAEIFRQYKHARVVVCTYDSPRYRQLYEGWTFIDKTRQKHLHAQNGRGARPKDAPEVLIVNGPSYTEKAA